MKSEFDKCEARELEPEDNTMAHLQQYEALWEDDEEVFQSMIKTLQDDPQRFVELFRRDYEEFGDALCKLVAEDFERQLES